MKVWPVRFEPLVLAITIVRVLVPFTATEFGAKLLDMDCLVVKVTWAVWVTTILSVVSVAV